MEMENEPSEKEARLIQMEMENEPSEKEARLIQMEMENKPSKKEPIEEVRKAKKRGRPAKPKVLGIKRKPKRKSIPARQTGEISMAIKVIAFFSENPVFRGWKGYADMHNIEFAKATSCKRRFYDTTSVLVTLGLLTTGVAVGFKWTGLPRPKPIARMARSAGMCGLLFKTCHLLQHLHMFRRDLFYKCMALYSDRNIDTKGRRVTTFISVFVALGWIKRTDKKTFEVTTNFPRFNSYGNANDDDYFVMSSQLRHELLEHEDIERLRSIVERYDGKVTVQINLPGKNAREMYRLEIERRIKESIMRENQIECDFLGDSPDPFAGEEN